MSKASPKLLNHPLNQRIRTYESRLIRDYVSQIQDDKNKEKILWRLIHRSKDSESGQNFQIGAANAITILNAARVSFSGMDLRHIRISHADLRNAILYDTDLRDAGLNETLLSEVMFGKTLLNNAQMTGVKFDQNPYISSEEGIILDLNFSPNGELLAGIYRETIGVWSLANFRKVTTMIGHPNKVLSMCFLSDNKNLRSVDKRGTIKLWNLETGEATISFIQPEIPSMEDVIFSPDGTLLAGARRREEDSSENTSIARHKVINIRPKDVYIWNVETQQLVIKFQIDVFGTVNKGGLHFIDAQRILVQIGKKIFHFDVITGKPLASFIGDMSRCLARSPDGSLSAFKGIVPPSTIRIWNIASLEPIFTLVGHSADVNKASFSSDVKSLISSGTDHTIRLWNLENGKLVRTIKINEDIRSVNFIPYTQSFVAATTTKILFFDKLEHFGRLGNVSEIGQTTITTLCLTPDRKSLLLWGGHKNLYYVDMITGEISTEFTEYLWVNVTSICFSPEGEYIVFADSRTQIQICERKTGKIWHKFRTILIKDDDMRQYHTDICCSVKGLLAVSNSSIDACVFLWDFVTRKICQTIKTNHPVKKLCFSSKGDLLSIRCRNNQIQIWDILSEKLLITLGDPCTSVILTDYLKFRSNDTEIIARSCSDFLADVWRINTKPALYTSLLSIKGARCFDVNPNNTTLACGTGLGTILIYNFTTYELLFSLNGHSQSIINLIFYENEKLLSVDEYNVSLWHLDLNTLRGYLRWRTGQELFAQEAEISDTIGLNDSDIRLLKQLGIKKLNDSDISSLKQLGIKGESLRSSITIESQGEHRHQIFGMIKRGNESLNEIQNLVNSGLSVDTTDRMGRSLLILAILSYQLMLVEYLVTAKANLDYTKGVGLTALCIASYYGYADIAEKLADAGANLDWQSRNGTTALLISAEQHHPEVAKILIAKGCKVDLANNIGETPLLIAVKNRNLETVQHLISAKVDVNKPDNRGQSPLSIAEDEDIVTQLIESKADVDYMTPSGWTPLAMASQRGNVKIVDRLLASGADPNLAEGQAMTPLTAACTSENELKLANYCAIVELLLDKGALVGNNMHNFPLFHASKNGNLRQLKLLIKAGANLNQMLKGVTPIFIAVMSGNLEVSKELIIAGADLANTNEAGIPLLHVASFNNHLQMIRLLLEVKVDINQSDRQGYTALSVAVAATRKDAVTELITRGADINKGNQHGLMPLDLAKAIDLTSTSNFRKRDDTDLIIYLLLEAGANNKNSGSPVLILPPITIKSFYYWTKLIRRSIAEGPKINWETFEFRNAIYLVICRDETTTLEEFVNLGLSVNSIINGKTLLNLACSHNSLSIIELLISKGADLQQEDPAGCTPVFAAIEKMHHKCVKRLIEAKADLNYKNKLGYTALGIACSIDDLETVKILIAAKADLNLTSNGYDAQLMSINILEENSIVPIAQKLMEFGIGSDRFKPNGTVEYEISPVSIVCLKENLGILEELIKAGADVKAINQRGNFPLQIACCQGNLRMVHKLLQAGAEAYSALQSAILGRPLTLEDDRSHIVKELLDAGADPNYLSDYRLPIHAACENGSLEILRQLINAGAILDKETLLDELPIFIACKSCNLAIVEELIEAGADLIRHRGLNLKDPLMIATEKNQPPIIKKLLEAGASPNRVNVDFDTLGQTPLSIAYEKGYEEIIQLLVKAGAINTRQADLNLSDSNSILVQPEFYEITIRNCKNVLSQFPEHIESLCLKGFILLAINEYQTAIECFDIILTHHPDALYIQGQKDLAIIASEID